MHKRKPREKTIQFADSIALAIKTLTHEQYGSTFDIQDLHSVLPDIPTKEIGKYLYGASSNISEVAKNEALHERVPFYRLPKVMGTITKFAYGYPEHSRVSRIPNNVHIVRTKSEPTPLHAILPANMGKAVKKPGAGESKTEAEYLAVICKDLCMLQHQIDDLIKIQRETLILFRELSQKGK